MKRFEIRKSSSPFRSLLVSLCLFAAVLGLFLGGIASLVRVSDQEQEDTIRSAVVQSAVHCYSLNGYYPESLEELVKEYGITYDSARFLVDYQPQGANLMPEITVLRKGR
ncbi:MAG TPA: hypothetical protein H9753_01580 [Candidatus Blautia merdavium]|uniref:Uncharacterized protein n=1 Tax=Candidatus Blautia merdavium TaxID=2838494 RepID=A0A9D2PMD9_9FIRM|nr:hypothetical protein [Candidatus Blautia merdavium]